MIAAAPREIRLDIEGGSLAALRMGDADGVPVLALHGWLDNAASFVPLAAHLRAVSGQVRDLLRNLACPVLAVYAEPAQSYFPEPLRSDRAALPADLRLVRLPGGHHLHMEQPGVVAGVVGPFLAGPTVRPG